MRNNLLAQFYAFTSALLAIILILALIKPTNCNGQSQMYTPESAVAVQVDLNNATIKTTQGSRIVVETTVKHANGAVVTTVNKNIQAIISEHDGIVFIKQPKTVAVLKQAIAERVDISYKVFIPAKLKQQ